MGNVWQEGSDTTQVYTSAPVPAGFWSDNTLTGGTAFSGVLGDDTLFRFGTDNDFTLSFDSVTGNFEITSLFGMDFSYTPDGVFKFPDAGLSAPNAVGGGMYYDGSNYYLAK